MKQSEKQDIILRWLYERRDDNREYSIKSILEESQVNTNYTEVSRLADILNQDKLIFLNDLSAKLKKAKISPKGITYCEESSYSSRGKSIVNNYHIVNSPQANIVVSSSQVEINQSQYEKAKGIIKEIRETASRDETLDLYSKTEILECLTEIEAGLSQQRVPKFAIKGLLSSASDVSSISSLAISLAQFLIPWSVLDLLLLFPWSRVSPTIC